MMTKIYLLLLLALGPSCSEAPKQRVQQQQKSIPPRHAKQSKLERLKRMPKGKKIVHCDLSHDNIRRFPNLSGYTIESLDLSHNHLDTVIVNYLPKGLIRLNLSYNQLKKNLRMSIDPHNKLSFKELTRRYASHPLRELNVSHNQIKWLSISFGVRKIMASHNDLRSVSFNHTNIKYLDISNNPHLSNVVDFTPEDVDTIIRNGIANDKPLIEQGKMLYQD